MIIIILFFFFNLPVEKLCFCIRIQQGKALIAENWSSVLLGKMPRYFLYKNYHTQVER